MIKFIQGLLVATFVALVSLVLLASYEALEQAANAVRLEPAAYQEAYKLVVTETLLPLLTTLTAALIGYVFVRGGMSLLNSYLGVRYNKSMDQICFW